MNDDVLRAALAADLDGAFERLVLTYQDRLFRFSLQLTGSRSDAEEVAQDALVRAYGALARYPADQIGALALQPWLYRITLNVVRNRIRRRQLPLAPLDGDFPAVNQGEQPEYAAEAAERQRELVVLLARLPERQRVAVILRHIEGIAYDEIAAIVNLPVGTVKAHVHRGMNTLRRSVEQRGDEAS